MTAAGTTWARLHSWWPADGIEVEQVGWSLRHQARGVPEPLSLIEPGFTYLAVDSRPAGLRQVRYRLRVDRMARAWTDSLDEAYHVAAGLGMDRTRHWWRSNVYNQRKARSPMPQFLTVWTIGEVVPITDRAPLPAEVRFNRNTGWLQLPDGL